MDARLLQYYERELLHLRETGGEFAREFPKIAGRLGLETYACADPYVERLLEGFSFLAARVQLKIDAEFPRFTEHLLELVYPQYLSPTPSMAVVKIQPDLTEGSLSAGFTIERGTALRSLLGKGDQTSCEYRTAHAVTIWPLELVDAKYFTYSGELAGLDLSRLGTIRAGLRLRLKTTAGLCFNEIALDKLPLYMHGSDSLPGKILEQILANAVAMVAMPVKHPATWHQIIPKSEIRRMGYADEQALLPVGPRSFQGYRLLQEYFAFPQRFMFAELGGLQSAVKQCPDKEMDIVILFDKVEPVLEQSMSATNFSLFCTPVINLFPKRADRVHLSDQQVEYHVVPDRTRPMDYEVYQVLSVTGYGIGPDADQTFHPFYRANDLKNGTDKAYYQIRRDQRVLSERQRKQGPRSSYIGSEIFLSLVDAVEAPYRCSLRQVGVDTLCTNRDLVLSMPVGTGKTDFTVESTAPVQSVRCLTGPTIPSPSHAEGETAWRLVSHLSLNYLSLIDSDQKAAGSALQDLLRLYCTTGEFNVSRQIDSVKSVVAAPVVRRLPVPGPITYGRGLQITVTIDEAAFEGLGVFVFGGVLEQFFAKYVSLNSFTETIIKTPRRGQVMKWPARVGKCEIL